LDQGLDPWYRCHRYWSWETISKDDL